jgi:hypothetical protein
MRAAFRSLRWGCTVGLGALLACTQALEPGDPRGTLPSESSAVSEEAARQHERSLLTGTWALADVTGDKLADLLVLSSCEAFVLRSDGTRFLPPAPWAEELPCRGLRGSAFADVTGDGRADALFVGSRGITVLRSDGERFLPGEDWTAGPYYGTVSTLFADVTGDGRADALSINDYGDGVVVRRSDGGRFLSNERLWTEGPYVGTVSTLFADVTGDNRADALSINDYGDGIVVRRATGSVFLPNEPWSGGVYLGTTGTFFADVTGDGLADALAFDREGLRVRRSDGAGFLPLEAWASGLGNDLSLTFFADVTGDGTADAVFRERHSGQWWVASSTGKALGAREKWF